MKQPVTWNITQRSSSGTIQTQSKDQGRQKSADCRRTEKAGTCRLFANTTEKVQLSAVVPITEVFFSCRPHPLAMLHVNGKDVRGGPATEAVFWLPPKAGIPDEGNGKSGEPDTEAVKGVLMKSNH